MERQMKIFHVGSHQFRIATGVAPGIVVSVLLKSWDAIPRMELRILRMEFRIPRAAPRMPRGTLREFFSPRMAFTLRECFFPEIGVVPRLLIFVAKSKQERVRSHSGTLDHRALPDKKCYCAHESLRWAKTRVLQTETLACWNARVLKH